ncbi:MAG: hypothetical protein QM703_19705 [Gemmatales bacterium]
MSAIARRCVLLATFGLLGLLPSGCIVTDWRWIWEDDNDQGCQKVQMQMAPPGYCGPGATMSVAVPAGN